MLTRIKYTLPTGNTISGAPQDWKHRLQSQKKKDTFQNIPVVLTDAAGVSEYARMERLHSQTSLDGASAPHRA